MLILCIIYEIQQFISWKVDKYMYNYKYMYNIQYILISM